MRHVIGAKVLIQLVHWPYLDCQCGLQSAIADSMLYLLGGVGQDDKASPAVFTAPLDFLFNHQLKWSSHQDLPWLCSAPVSIQGRSVLVMGGAKLLEDT